MKLYYFNPYLGTKPGDDILLFSLSKGKLYRWSSLRAFCPIKLQLLSQLCKRTRYNHFDEKRKKRKRKGKNKLPRVIQRVVQFDKFSITTRWRKYYRLSCISRISISNKGNFLSNRGERSINLIINDTPSIRVGV